MRTDMRVVEPDAVIERLRDSLLRHACLFDDPGAYAAGVEDALAAVAADGPRETPAG